MLVPLALLGFGALFAGLAFHGVFIGEAYGEFWKGALFTSEHNHILHAIHDVPTWVSYSPFVMMVGGFLLAVLFYIVFPHIPGQLAASQPLLYKFLLNKWYFDELYDAIFVKPSFKLGRLFWKGGDGAIIDGLGPDGVAARVVDGSRLAVRLQTGYIYNYAFAMLIGVAAIVTYFVAGGLR